MAHHVSLVSHDVFMLTFVSTIEFTLRLSLWDIIPLGNYPFGTLFLWRIIPIWDIILLRLTLWDIIPLELYSLGTLTLWSIIPLGHYSFKINPLGHYPFGALFLWDSLEHKPLGTLSLSDINPL